MEHEAGMGPDCWKIIGTMGGSIGVLCGVIVYMFKYIAGQWASKAADDKETIVQLRAVKTFSSKPRTESPQ